MNRLAATIALRLLICSVVSYGLWRLLGPVGLATSAPLFGLAFAKPLFELMAGFRDLAKARSLKDVQGMHFSFRGITIHILQDELHQRWVRLADVRKVLPTLPRDVVLLKKYGDRVAGADAPLTASIEADTLRLHLAHATDDTALRFRNWLERDVCRPAAEMRRRLGIHSQTVTPEQETPQ